MAEITLLRHGQASFGASNYDQLSELGYQQAYWLGEHLQGLGKTFDRVVLGTMVRHRQTADSFFEGYLSASGAERPDYCYDAGLNEYQFQGLLTPFRELYPGDYSASGDARRDYYDNLKQALGHWMAGRIESDGLDSWSSFRERVWGVFDAACESDAKRTLVVTSGGPIATILARILRLDHTAICELNMQIRNTSTSRILHNRQTFALDSFNDVAHLQQPQRQDAITFA